MNLPDTGSIPVSSTNKGEAVCGYFRAFGYSVKG